MAVDMDAGPLHGGMIAVDRAEGGHLSFETGREIVRSGPDRPVLVPPSGPWRGTWNDLDVEIVTLDWHAVAGHAADTTGIEPDDLVFHGMGALSAARARYWTATVDHVRTAVLDDPFASASPIIRRRAFHQLAAALLVTFPNSALDAVTDPHTHRRRISAGDLRRALDHLDDHAGDPITRADVARHVGADPAAVDHALHQQDTDIAHLLWRTRLHRAHRELQRSDPSVGVTVASVARRWGFRDTGRFSAAYRTVFGHGPQQTLDG